MKKLEITTERSEAMNSVRSFTEEEGTRVKQFIQDFLETNPWMTEMQIRNAAEKVLPDIDCVSAVFHVLNDMQRGGLLRRRSSGVYSLIE